jgi:hypothetical protein
VVTNGSSLAVVVAAGKRGDGSRWWLREVERRTGFSDGEREEKVCECGRKSFSLFFSTVSNKRGGKMATGP